MKVNKRVIEFEWDKGNIDKNFKKHRVTDKESEEVFINQKKIIMKDEKHSLREARYMLWGKTKIGRKLIVFFTLRDNKVRIISARDMSRKERNSYEKKIQTNTSV